MAKNDRISVNERMDDLLGNVISKDRQTSGRAAVEPKPGVQPTNPNSDDSMTITQYDNVTILQEDKQTNKQPDKQTDNQANRQADKQSPGKTDKLVAGPRLKASENDQPNQIKTLAEIVRERTEEAAKMGGTGTTTVTLRIPIELNEWLDEYTHAYYKEKVKKQDLVKEALTLLYLKLGRPGEIVIESEFSL